MEAMMKRTDYCGTLRAADEGREVVLSGWVMSRRDHGGLIFIDLRDREGLVQVVFDPTLDADTFALAEAARNEYVVNVSGIIRARLDGATNPNMDTGDTK